MVSKTLNNNFHTMKNVKSRTEWLNEKANVEFENLHEDTMIDIDIMLDDKPEAVIKSIEGMEGVQKTEVLPFGVIKAKAPKKMIGAIKGIEGVEDVEIQKKK
jgi:predicted regulator of amino acid metabolism with ACT domain